MGDGETFEEILLRADLIERHIGRMHERGQTAHGARAVLDHADSLIAADLERFAAELAGAQPFPDLIAAGDYGAASERLKDYAVSLGADSGAFRVFVVPESAAVTIDGVVVS